MTVTLAVFAATLGPVGAQSGPGQSIKPRTQQPVTPHDPVPAPQNGQCGTDREWSALNLRDYWPTEGRVRSLGSLGYMGRQDASKQVDLAEARTQVERIVRVSGLEMNFEMVVDPSTPAAAAIINGRRVILFDPRFMAQVADRICPDWGGR